MYHSITDNELVKQLENLAIKEHDATVQILVCLGELDRRRAFLKLGYSSIYALCTRRLKYSEGAAHRRICSARVIREYPDALKLLETRQVSTTTLAMIQPILRPENSKEILESVAGQSRDVVEKIVALRRAPTAPRRDTVRAIIVRSLGAGASAITTVNESTEKMNLAERESVKSVQETVAPSPVQSGPAQAGTFACEGKLVNNSKQLPEMPELKYKINFEVRADIVKKLKRLREIRPYKNLEELFELLLDSYLKRNAPENRRESDKPSVGRLAPMGLRASVLKRDNYQCSFIGEHGERCKCKSDLQIDHVYPVALGGRTELGNLRTLCSAHNRYEAKRVLGSISKGVAYGNTLRVASR